MKFEPRPPILSTKYLIGWFLIVFGVPLIFIMSMLIYMKHVNQAKIQTEIQQPPVEKGTRAFMSVCLDGKLNIPTTDGSMMPVVNDRLEFLKC